METEGQEDARKKSESNSYLGKERQNEWRKPQVILEWYKQVTVSLPRLDRNCQSVKSLNTNRLLHPKTTVFGCSRHSVLYFDVETFLAKRPKWICAPLWEVLRCWHLSSLVCWSLTLIWRLRYARSLSIGLLILMAWQQTTKTLQSLSHRWNRSSVTSRWLFCWSHHLNKIFNMHQGNDCHYGIEIFCVTLISLG
jgi:hypothetical protein